MSALERTTARLRLRRPTPVDLPAFAALHGDPRTYAHAPGSMPTPEQRVERFGHDLTHWDEHGFGYAAVEDRATATVIGWGGVARADEPTLNLYYRLEYAALGRGLGRELARAVVEACVEDLPERRVRARVLPHNAASLAVARSAGLEETGFDAGHVVLEPPRLERRDELTSAEREEVLDLWVRVNEAGGAVGFVPGAARDDVRRALARQTERAETAGLLRSPSGRLLGLGFWERGDWWGQAHLLVLKRLMVDPDRRGRGTGRVLMAGLHGLARRLPDVELWHLTYRSGLGLGRFYSGLGWTETGRLPLGLRLGPDDRRDSVSMCRLPDGSPIRADGRE